ncbi:hypothetical protein [Psychrobacter sp. W2-37-MNA-CIBAN-0211]|uniref:hypothetical protein n=1 Tax=Psychrobacter sp. W2-37-MNA-CIBAN-0211 TaxID=3140443 RepID=UPI0033237B4B
MSKTLLQNLVSDNAGMTLDEHRFEQLKQNAAQHKTNAQTRFNNMALTQAGELCIGMSRSNEWNRYSCSYMEVDGVRLNDPRRWDLYGNSSDHLSDLRLDTVQVGVRTI